jgi:nucleoside-diphosphate-sugar epimerase
MKTNDLSVTIIGCGWLGVPLGKALVEMGHRVQGSVRSESGFEPLIEAGIHPFALNLETSTQVPKEITAKTDLLIITLPPIDAKHPERFEGMLRALIAQFSEATRILFTSSTGIYPKEAGDYAEDFVFNAEQDSTVLNRAEAIIRNSKQAHVIFRLGGLMGPNRHPIRFLQGRKGVKNPHGSIQFVHQGDVIRAMLLCVEKVEISGTFNLVFPEHPTRKSYYDQAAKHYGFAPPIFEESEAVERRISVRKFQESAGFSFDFPIDTFPLLEID